MSALIGWLVLFLAAMGGCATMPDSKTDVPAAMQDKQSGVEDQWGVKVLRISLSAEGYMLDFRYRVFDPEKAMPLFDRKIKPVLIDEATGAVFAVPEPPKTGSLRTTRPPERDTNYFIIFAHPGRYVKKGSKVTVVIGDFKAKNLVVE
jgi:hypothetical protein